MNKDCRRFTRVEEAIQWLFQQLPMFQRDGPMALKKDLSRTIAFDAYLNHPTRFYPTIHIAGTNGKGSVTHILAAAFQAAGFRVGVYTSPHYRDYRERIKINGQLIPNAMVLDFINGHYETLSKLGMSFFEATFGMATKYFEDEKVDIAIFETGLGGRLDSTNIITPILSIITNIGYDHQQFLGETLPEIASEKAGIIKANVPVIIGEYQQETMPVFLAKAKAMHAPLTLAEDAVQVLSHSLQSLSGNINYYDNDLPFESDLSGPYQHLNINTAWAAWLELMKLSIDNKPSLTPTSFINGLKQVHTSTHFLGRYQIISDQPIILLDSAHNINGIQQLVTGIQQMDVEHIHIVFGTVSDKDPKEILRTLDQSLNHPRFYFAQAKIPRAMSTQQLSNNATDLSLHSQVYTSVPRALAAAKRRAKPQDLIVVCGSIFVVAEVV